MYVYIYIYIYTHTIRICKGTISKSQEGGGEPADRLPYYVYSTCYTYIHTSISKSQEGGGEPADRLPYYVYGTCYTYIHTYIHTYYQQVQLFYIKGEMSKVLFTEIRHVTTQEGELLNIC